MNYFAVLFALVMSFVLRADAESMYKSRELNSAAKLKQLCKRPRYYNNNKRKCNKFLMNTPAPVPAPVPSPTTSAPAASMTYAPAARTMTYAPAAQMTSAPASQMTYY